MIPERFIQEKKKNSAARSNLCVAYIRVSTDDQKYNESLDTQRDSIQKYADQNGLIIDKWFIDDGASAKTVKKRDGIKDLLYHCARNKGKYGYVLLYKLQRLSRNSVTWAADFKLTIMALGIGVRSATEHIDETPTGRFLEVLLVANGQLDNDIKSGIVKDNMSSIAKQGWWQGGPPPGYRTIQIKINPKKTHTTLVKNKYANAVRELCKAYSTGQYTRADIARMSREKESLVKNSQDGFLNDTAVNRLLSQPAIAGYICNKHTDWEPYEGKHINDAIIGLDLFEKIQKIIEIQSKSANRFGKPKLMNNSLYPLKHTLLCYNCGNDLRASAPKSGGGKYSPRYHCPRQSCKGVVKSVKADVVHERFAQLLEDITASDGVLKGFKEILKRLSLSQLDNINGRLKGQRDALTELDNERLRTLRSATNEQITSEEKDEILTNIIADKTRVQDSIDELEKLQRISQSTIEYTLNFMNNVKKLWIDADSDLKQKFQKMIFPEGLTFDSQTLNFGTNKISLLYRYIINKKDLSESEKSRLVIPRGIEPLCPG